jgi:hypothetical protein
MASVIPKMYRKEITDTLFAETLKVALFTNTLAYDPLNVAHTTYTQIAALFTEVSAVGTGYVTGGYALTTTSGYIGATNVAALTAVATAVAAATFTCRYAVVYENTGKKIRAVIDLGGDKTVTSGTMTITWDTTNGIISVA